MNPTLYFSNGFKDKIFSFLGGLSETNFPGYFRYSFSGDLFDHSKKENLAGSIFALKIYYILGIKDQKIIQPIINRILSFQNNDGSIFDPYVYKKSFIRNVGACLKRGRVSNLDNHEYVYAESRQSYSAMLLHDYVPERCFVNIPTSPKKIKVFLQKLDWSKPWSAGSHFSHLMFFLSYLKRKGVLDHEVFEAAKHSAIHYINSIQHNEDGAWYVGSPSHREKVNGAMKVLTGLLWVDTKLSFPERLIDLCLSGTNSVHACDELNKILVLRHAEEAVAYSYRRKELDLWLLNTLSDWKKYYFPEIGGFSFWEGRANEVYYGVRVSRGFNEPDIHGTLLFLWGLSMVAQLLPIPELSDFHEIKS